jgi:excisionase family DNA binding protein
MTEDPLMLTVREAAEILRLGRDRTYQLIHEGRLPAIRLGRSIRVPREALDRFIQKEMDQAAAV